MLNSYDYLNKYVKILDKKDNTCIASGKVKSCKNNIDGGGISFDDKWFFRQAKNLEYEIVDFAEFFIAEEFPNHIKIEYWRNFNSDDLQSAAAVDIWRDFCYDEIDAEIKPFIDELNDIPNIKTTSSCCGHGSFKWYIEFLFLDFENLCNFVNIVETFNGKLYLGTNLRTGNLSKKAINFTLKPQQADNDYALLVTFIKRLKKFTSI